MRSWLLIALLAIAPVVLAQSLTGVWEAKINFNGVEIPCKIEFGGDGKNIRGWFFNGEERETSTSGTFENGQLDLHFDDYATELTATLKDGGKDGGPEGKDGTREGQWVSAQKKSYPLQAKRFVAAPARKVAAPVIDGRWEVEGVSSTKGESTWRLIVRQNGADVSAAILRVDGDTGALTGSYKDGKFVLSHFSGARPSLLTLTPLSDGTLEVDLAGPRGHNEYRALRPAEARAKGLPEPADASAHTRVKDASQPFLFSFPDLSGKLVSNDDARFRGKVVLVNITGSWCPNCHDEAPFLAELYRKYRDQGLEIVALSFEEGEQLKDPTRLRAFVKKYGIEYTVLLAGEPSEAKEKLAQAENWDAWPTTFFLDREGLVRGVHAGFAGRATGELYVEAKQEFVRNVEKLLGDRKSSSRE
jgi:thiol-disulfide isomerase/thioredoxin